MELLFLNLEKFYAVAVMVVSSLYFRFLLQLFGQTWIKTLAHTATLTLLPVLTFVITNVISGNIALSLGMVGALSIVRFRNPVRSPLELSVYFGAITMGITAAVSFSWLVFLVLAVTFIVLVLFLTKLFWVRFLKTQFFITSFSEGNNLASLVVTTKQKISKVENHYALTSKTVVGDEVTYRLADANFSILKEIEQELQETTEINSIQLSK